jgi:superfamily II helicase
MTEPHMIICGPHDGGPVIPGSIVMVCADCGEEVYLSPSGQKMFIENQSLIICVPCARERMKTDPNVIVHSPTPEQIAELRQFFLGRD